ncbi:MAG: hypothetical protein KDC57_09465 [Saprospiraceae bacterium]|nr:hypothetical protein [Saprospiraceae bacterium]
MKKLAFILAFSMVTMSGLLAQSTSELFTAKIKKGEVPGEIIAAIEKDFPKMIAQDFQTVPGEFINGTFVLNSENLDTYNNEMYRIYLNAKNGFEATALYDKHGHLVSAREYWKNKPLPENVAKAVGELYPGWALNSDFERITITNNDVRDAFYRVILKKGHDKMKITMDEFGNEIDKGNANTM